MRSLTSLVSTWWWLEMSGFNTPATVAHPGYVSGRWYCSVLGCTTTSGAAISANSIRLLPFIITKPIPVAQLAANVTTSSAAGNFQLAIYAHNATTGRPTGTALCSTANMSTASVAAVSAAVTQVTLPPGIYWGAVNQDNAVAAYVSLANTAPLAGNLIGSATLATVSGATALVSLFLTVAQTFGTWPDLTSGSFAESNGTTAALVYLKAA
ncbi:MAG: hypothetical protein JWR80_9475 [Bradyrhizobium sp.]|nr:hypothetical protein [Bradyrhizobium sp.]